MCTRCSRPFETTIEGQTECTPCLLKPSNCNDIEIDIEEELMEKHFKERNCNCCGDEYEPTSPSQKRCQKCIDAGKKNPDTSKPLSEKSANPKTPETEKAIVQAIYDVMHRVGASSMTFTVTRNR